MKSVVAAGAKRKIKHNILFAAHLCDLDAPIFTFKQSLQSNQASHQFHRLIQIFAGTKLPKNKSMNKRTLLYIAAACVLAFTWYRYRMPRFVAGEKAPDIALSTLDGTASKLSDLQGKFVLLQFWGSWCGPCRAENPHLVDLYKKYHDKGFEIVSLGIESNAANWQRAIQQDQMTWPYHSSELNMFDGAIPKSFNIKSIPTTFLLNREGVIMGVSLEPDQIEKRLAAALTN